LFFLEKCSHVKSQEPHAQDPVAPAEIGGLETDVTTDEAKLMTSLLPLPLQNRIA